MSYESSPVFKVMAHERRRLLVQSGDCRSRESARCRILPRPELPKNWRPDPSPRSTFRPIHTLSSSFLLYNRLPFICLQSKDSLGHPSPPSNTRTKGYKEKDATQRHARDLLRRGGYRGFHLGRQTRDLPLPVPVWRSIRDHQEPTQGWGRCR